MSMEAARAFHERALSDSEFRREVESSGDEMSRFIRASGYRFEPEEWDRLHQEMDSEAREARRILERLESCDEAGALAEARQSLERWPLSWRLLDVYAAVLARSGQRDEARTLLAKLTPSQDRVAYLDPEQRYRVLDILSSSVAYALRPPPASEIADRSEDAVGPDEPEGGGWSMSLRTGTWPTRHQVDCRPDLSVRDFIQDYVFRNLPVIMGNLIEDWPAHHCWRRDSLLAKHGTTEVEVHPSRSVVENLRHERQTERICLADYVDRMVSDPAMTYLFSVLPFSRIKDDFIEPAHFSQDTFANDMQQRVARTFFYLGGSGSGVRFHQHEAAWNALVFGYKRWFLLPPHGIHRYRDVDIAELVRSNPQAPDLIEFVQLPGEVVFVPQYWHHATYNLTDCIGVVREIGVIDDLASRLRTNIET